MTDNSSGRLSGRLSGRFFGRLSGRFSGADRAIAAIFAAGIIVPRSPTEHIINSEND